MDYGDADGYGRYGQLTVSEDGERLVCHECGQPKKALGTHAWYVHGITAADYRRRHGLSTGQGLASPATAARFSQLGSAPAALAALQTHRDPAKARAANQPAEANRRAQRQQTRRQVGATARRGRSLTEAEVERLDAAASSIATWATVAWDLVHSGVTRAEIARTLNMPAVTVDQRLRRYPRLERTPGAEPEAENAGLDTATGHTVGAQPYPEPGDSRT